MTPATAQRADRGVGRKNNLTSGMFTTGPDDWPTPQAFFDQLNDEFSFHLDPCALPYSAKCERFFGPDDDGLSQRWTGSVFMNPPYGRAIGKWVAKAHDEAKAGATVVCLLPARTCTRWWHEHVMKAAEVRFIKGRLKFGESDNAAPFPSAVVVFRPGHREPRFSTMPSLPPTPCPDGQVESVCEQAVNLACEAD